MLPRENIVCKGAQVWVMPSWVVVTKRVSESVDSQGSHGGGGPKEPRSGVRLLGDRMMFSVAVGAVVPVVVVGGIGAFRARCVASG